MGGRWLTPIWGGPGAGGSEKRQQGLKVMDEEVMEMKELSDLRVEALQNARQCSCALKMQTARITLLKRPATTAERPFRKAQPQEDAGNKISEAVVELRDDWPWTEQNKREDVVQTLELRC